MKKIMEHISGHFERLPDLLRKRRLVVLILFMVTTGFFFYQMGRTKFDMTVEAWFEDDDPTLVAFDGFHAEFGSEDHVFVVYRPKDGDVFSAQSLEAAKGIRDELLNRKLKKGNDSALKHIVRITTLTNAPVLRAEADTLISGHLVEKNVPTSREELEKVRGIAKEEKKFPLLYYSKDHKYGGIFIETDFGAIPVGSHPVTTGDVKQDGELKMDDMTVAPGNAKAERVRFQHTDLKDYLALMSEIKDVLKKPQYAGHLTYYPVGQSAATEYDLKVLKQMGAFNLAAILVIMALLWFLFRSVSAIVWPVVIVVLSIIWTVGIAAWAGFTVTSFIMLMVMLLITIGVTDAIHVLSGYIFHRDKGFDHKTSLRAVYKSEGGAMLLTAITNMVGILALNITPIVPIKVFAMMSAAGIALALFFTLYLLPLLLDVWAPSPKKEEEARRNRLSALMGRLIPDFTPLIKNQLEKVLPLSKKYAAGFLAVFVITFGICLFGATKIKVDTDPVGQYPKDSAMRRSVAVVDKNMMGAHNLELFMDLGKENAFLDPSVLNIMDELQHKIETKYKRLIVRTSSLSDVTKDAYKKLNGGDESKYIIPADPQVLSQTLFLFNNANPDDRRRYVSDNYSKSHISIQVHNTGSAEYQELFNQMQKDIDEAVAALKPKYPDAKIAVTGMLALLMKAADYLVWNELQSFVFALCAVSMILFVVFSSFKAGLIALIPNLIPSILTFGLMGFFGIPLDFFTMMIAPVIIGVSIDDTVHFVNQYMNEVAKDGDIERALEHTIRESGLAIMFTSLVLGFGFCIMAFSSSTGISNVGKFGSLAVFAGLLNDLFLLPVIIFTFRFEGKRSEQQQPALVTATQFPLAQEEE